MRDLADRYAFVQPDDRCCLSGGPILAKKFAVFPCMVDQQQCMFYEDELAKEVERISNPAQKRRLKELKAQMNAVRISVQYSTVQYSTVQYSTVHEAIPDLSGLDRRQTIGLDHSQQPTAIRRVMNVPERRNQVR
jgi:hypothetical protein